MKTLSLILGCVALLTACAGSSGVQKMGPDTYTIYQHASAARGGTAAAKRMALQEANNYCSQMGREILVTNWQTQTTNRMGQGNADIEFRCLLSGDPDLVRPVYEKAPNTVIENRNN